jgi:hypothetical protein
MDERGALCQRLLHVGNRVERFVVDVHELRRVLRRGAAVGDHHGDAVALEAGLLDRERVMRRHPDVLGDGPGAGQRALPVARQVRTAERGDHAFRRTGGVEREAADARVRVGAPNDRHVDGARKREVVDEAGASRQERPVLPTGNRRAQVAGGTGNGAHLTPSPAAASTARTMLW